MLAPPRASRGWERPASQRAVLERRAATRAGPLPVTRRQSRVRSLKPEPIRRAAALRTSEPAAPDSRLRRPLHLAPVTAKRNVSEAAPLRSRRRRDATAIRERLPPRRRRRRLRLRTPPRSTGANDAAGKPRERRSEASPSQAADLATPTHACRMPDTVATVRTGAGGGASYRTSGNAAGIPWRHLVRPDPGAARSYHLRAAETTKKMRDRPINEPAPRGIGSAAPLEPGWQGMPAGRGRRPGSCWRASPRASSTCPTASACRSHRPAPRSSHWAL